jgi:hypothetical protein
VPSIKPTSADAQLLFSVAGEGLARLDIGQHHLVTTQPLHLHVLHPHLSHQFLLDLFLYLFRIN